MRLGIYPGSFNPFHKGHLNILEKAEKLFDKVIVARGVNLEKANKIEPMPKSLGRDVVTYGGLLTDYLKELNHDNVTVIRGLRSPVDFQAELAQYRYFQDLDPNIQVIMIVCDKEYDHVSSSGIRLLKNYGDKHIQKYLVK